MNRLYRTLSVAVASLGGLLLPAGAVIIKVSDPGGGSDYSQMKAVVQEVRTLLNDKKSPVPSEIRGYAITVAEGNLMTTELSITPGTSAVYWSDKGVAYQKGFSFNGGRALFLSGDPSVKPEAPKAHLGPEIFQNRLATASLVASRLTLRYSLAEAGPVKVELFSGNGSLVKRWNWVDGSAGVQSRTLDVPQLGNGRHFIRWTNGRYQATQLLIPGKGGGPQ